MRSQADAWRGPKRPLGPDGRPRRSSCCVVEIGGNARETRTTVDIPTNPVGFLCYRRPKHALPHRPPTRRTRPMPAAIPAGAAAHLPPARMIDPRGHRFGAGVSAILLGIAFVTGTPWLVALVLAVDRVERGVRPALLDLRRHLAADRPGRRPRQGRAGARVSAAVRPGPRQHRAHPVARRPSPSARRRSAGSSRSPSRRSRRSSRSPATAWAAGSTSCAGGCPTS